MIAYDLAQAASVVGGEVRAGSAAGGQFRGLATDSRRIKPGELFVALRGPNHDGHGFVAGALERGAAAAMVERFQSLALPQIRVADSIRALGRLAAAWRRGFRYPLIALTGSNGKTTVKEMLASILRQCGPVLATEGNLNNHIGVPLTLARLGPEYAYAVIEMGANHAGEIGYLSELTRPDVALITNAGPAHLEGFGSIDGVARAKGEIYHGLGGDGVAVVNADDDYAGYWQSLNDGRRTVDFGLERPAQVKGEPASGDRFVLRLNGSVAGEVRIALPGKHNIRNALAAAAAAYAVGASAAAIVDGLAAVQPVGGRLRQLPGRCGSTLLDDSYNANPASLVAGLEALAADPGEDWLVLGDMAELGDEAAALHAAGGDQARALGVTRVFALGPLSVAACRAFGAGAAHFDDHAGLISALLDAVQQAPAPPRILIKGSRSMKMEQVVAALADSARRSPPC